MELAPGFKQDRQRQSRRPRLVDGGGGCSVQVCARAGRTAASRGTEHTPVTCFGKNAKQ